MESETNEIEEISIPSTEEQLQPKNQDTETEKLPVPGVIYISFLPPRMTPLHLRQIFEKYGEVGRIFLQPEDPKPTKKKRLKPKYNQGTFTEGWLEFGDKTIAKRLALTMNNTLISDGKKSKFKDFTWSIKYLHRFSWRHLTERLAHEREVRKQRMRVEQAQARRETAAFISNVEKSKKLSSIKDRREKRGVVWEEKRHMKKFKQRKTVEEMRIEKLKKLSNLSSGVNNHLSDGLNPRKSVLSQIFGM
uniref:Activator of basal transcription 1 n=1 Tax=Ciona savignyi TaxID=51511 RepID=H2YMQ4_CIOSA